MKFNDSVIMTIPGIGYINGGMILGEIGDIHRFSNQTSCLLLLVWIPSVYQSGNFQAKTTRMSKRGSRVFTICPCKCSLERCQKQRNLQRLIMMPRELKAGLTTMHLGIVRQTCQVIWKMLTDNVEFNLK
ncbi:IS110 family transposase [Roseburia intestinalis]